MEMGVLALTLFLDRRRERTAMTSPQPCHNDKNEELRRSRATVLILQGFAAMLSVINHLRDLLK